MAGRPDPYVRRDPGDVIRSGDWNELQVLTREEIAKVQGDSAGSFSSHRHTGSDGLKIPRNGIEAGAIDGSLIDKGASITIKDLSVSGALNVTGKTSVKTLSVKTGLRVEGTSSLGVTNTQTLSVGSAKELAELNVNGTVALGHEKVVTDFGAPNKSGFYQNAGKKITGDVPDKDHSWTHLLASRHDNPKNNHQLQIASSYAENDKLYFRKIAEGALKSRNPAWLEIATRGTNRFTASQYIDSGELYAKNGVIIEGARKAHLDNDGALYRYGGQFYIVVDDNLYIRDSRGDIKFHFDTNKGIIRQDRWVAPKMVNKWVNYSARSYNSAGYYKDRMGVVHLRGLVKGGTVKNTIFTLPAGFRPPRRELRVVMNADITGRLDVLTDGRVYTYSPSNKWVSLDGISFRVD